MNLLAIVLVGALLGWLASLLTRSAARGERAGEERPGTFSQIATGAAGAFVAGGLTGNMELLAGLSAETLIAAALGALALLVIVAGLRNLPCRSRHRRF